jgi:hypothetical protein
MNGQEMVQRPSKPFAREIVHGGYMPAKKKAAKKKKKH